jgi:hypothetical protein
MGTKRTLVIFKGDNLPLKGAGMLSDNVLLRREPTNLGGVSTWIDEILRFAQNDNHDFEKIELESLETVQGKD